jgi:hypothetical protein
MTTLYLISTAAGGVGVGGGGQTFARHMLASFKAVGQDVRLLQLTTGTRTGLVSIGDRFDTHVERVHPENLLALAKHNPCIIVTPDYGKYLPEGAKDIQTRLMRLGARMIVHDPKPFDKRNVHPDDFAAAGLGRKLPTKPIFIRPTMKEFWPDGVFIPHPFVPMGLTGTHHKIACSLGRIESAKRSVMIHDANKLLPKKLKIDMFGKENRLYTYAKGMPQGCYGFPIDMASEQLLGDYKIMFDMSWFTADGGGSQYTFMEAWDAGTVPVVHSDWLDFKGEMVEGVNCLRAMNTAHIADIVRAVSREGFGDTLAEIAATGRAHLHEKHNPKKIAKMYLKELGL